MARPSSGKIALAGVAAALTLGALAHAQTPVEDMLGIAYSLNFSFLCDQPESCGPAVPPEQSRPSTETGLEVVQELDDILAWLRGMRYPDAKAIRRKDERMVVTYNTSAYCTGGGEKVVLGCYDPSTQELIITPTAFDDSAVDVAGRTALEDLGSTLAHEYSHAVIGRFIPTMRWLNEAMAEAIGNIWQIRKNRPAFSIDFPAENSQLNRPFHHGETSGYDRSYYFEFVGRRLNPQEPVAWMAPLYDQGLLLSPSYNGLDRLYGASAGAATFDKAFPRYVAGINPRGLAALRNYYKSPKIHNGLRWPGGEDDTLLYTEQRSVAAFSADPIVLRSIRIAQPPREHRDALMVVEVSLSDIETGVADPSPHDAIPSMTPGQATPEHMSLALEHQLGGGENRLRQRFLIRARSAQNLGLVRAVNAPPSLGTAANINYRLNLRGLPVRFELPDCVAPGATGEITAEDPSRLTDVSNYTFRVSRGSMDEFTFHAPSQAGMVDVSIEIQSHITSGPAFRPVRRAPQRYVIGQVKVDPSCASMIRMTMNNGPGPVTYDHKAGYTEFASGRGEALYFISGDRTAAWMNGGWVDGADVLGRMIFGGGMLAGMDMAQESIRNLPPEARAAIQKQMGRDPAAMSLEDLGLPLSGDVVNEDGVPANVMWFLPRHFTERFSWERLSRIVRVEAPQQPVSTPVACPYGGSGCRRITLNRAGPEHVAGVYDDGRRLVLLEMDSARMRFEYGEFNIRRPPGVS